MAIDVLVAGDELLATWFAAVANQLNRTQCAVLTSDVSKAASSWSDITGLTLPVVAGKYYRVRATIIWDQSSTSGGIRIGANFPSGNYRAMVRYTGEASDTAFVNEWDTVADGGTGVATADSTSARIVLLEGRYNCDADGTFALRYYRNTTGTAKIQTGSSLELVSDS